ncbi:MAG: hypothetical protein ACXVBC_07865 [Bdellovibrionota bacterium]
MKSILVIGLSAVAASCAHGKLERQLDQKLAEAPTVTGSSELGELARQRIEESRSLDSEKKAKLLELQKVTGAQNRALRDESLKLRALLIEDVTQAGDQTAEVDLIKARLKKLENQRLALIFSAVDQANTILGHMSERDRYRTLRDLYDIEPRGGRD